MTIGCVPCASDIARARSILASLAIANGEEAASHVLADALRHAAEAVEGRLDVPSTGSPSAWRAAAEALDSSLGRRLHIAGDTWTIATRIARHFEHSATWMQDDPRGIQLGHDVQTALGVRPDLRRQVVASHLMAHVIQKTAGDPRACEQAGLAVVTTTLPEGEGTATYALCSDYLVPIHHLPPDLRLPDAIDVRQLRAAMTPSDRPQMRAWARADANAATALGKASFADALQHLASGRDLLHIGSDPTKHLYLAAQCRADGPPTTQEHSRAAIAALALSYRVDRAAAIAFGRAEPAWRSEYLQFQTMTLTGQTATADQLRENLRLSEEEAVLRSRLRASLDVARDPDFHTLTTARVLEAMTAESVSLTYRTLRAGHPDPPVDIDLAQVLEAGECADFVRSTRRMGDIAQAPRR